ncbi:MAG: AtpZ/AtpI family protein [Bacteroidetes bacterium]|nr:AtpZ/AtpI family protein [Bacteroidota bacterium]MBS1628879.1 AtpZ/AtpI family protein [Bacteroidota bacterium]
MGHEENNPRAWMRYAGLGTQLLVLLGLGVWGGLRLDAWLQFRALFVILLPVLALAISFIQLYRSLNKK